MAVKRFILDTNVILHDHRCIYNFQENDIFLPITVLEELDKFKKGNDDINFNAREFSRDLDLLADSAIFTKGVSLGTDLGRLYILTAFDYPPQLEKAFSERTPDHRILAAAMLLQQKHRNTILVSKDINLRLKAKSLGLNAEDYISDKVTSKDVFDKEHVVFPHTDTALINRMYNEPEGVNIEEFSFRSDIDPNDCFVLKNNKASVLAHFNPFSQKVERVEKNRIFGIEPRNAEQAFAFQVLRDKNIKLVALTGKSGTGKTLLALAAALDQHNDYQQILLARPIVALGNRDLGYLPGDDKRKVSPYMQPLFDNLNVIKHQFNYQGKEVFLIDEMQREQKLLVEALAYIRGRSLNDTFFIVDEAQNLTPHEIKTIITRAGEDSKIVFTGDIQQIDQPYLDMHSNGLVYMIDRMRGQDIFAHINLIKGERSLLSELASNLL
jgi:PhoH-like ATPase